MIWSILLHLYCFRFSFIILFFTDVCIFRSLDLAERKKYVALVDSVKEYNGDVKIFSSLHISGEQLEQLTGIAAILRYPMPEIESDDDPSDGDSD
ncbi:Protein pelota [Amphibalanus amphitrite]|uniref:Protein pelota n=1 Tax=Amphibalanus amphitrite TaxID=1232801 RepID=A0A6A4VWW9_AMPAM|nr:Protein pelota [Amphibalanus amphitrite]